LENILSELGRPPTEIKKVLSRNQRGTTAFEERRDGRSKRGECWYSANP